MNIEQFPNCCGANILHGFGAGWHDEKTFIELVKKNISLSHGGIVFGITNLQQNREGKLLAKCGFKKIKKFPNPNTGLQELTLWGYDRVNSPQKIASKIASLFYRLVIVFGRWIERRHRRAIGG